MPPKYSRLQIAGLQMVETTLIDAVGDVVNRLRDQRAADIADLRLLVAEVNNRSSHREPYFTAKFDVVALRAVVKLVATTAPIATVTLSGKGATVTASDGTAAVYKTVIAARTGIIELMGHAYFANESAGQIAAE